MAKKKRKTREEKIIADLRRELQSARKALSDTNQAEKTQKSVKKEKELPTPTMSATSQASPYLKKDLTKSLILAIMAIAFELAIYYILPGGKFKFF